VVCALQDVILQLKSDLHCTTPCGMRMTYLGKNGVLALAVTPTTEVFTMFAMFASLCALAAYRRIDTLHHLRTIGCCRWTGLNAKDSCVDAEFVDNAFPLPSDMLTMM
jgi:hypothetical protein